MKSLIFLLIFSVGIVGCGGSGSSASGGGSPAVDQVGEIKVPDETTYASTLVYPGANALYFGDSIDFVGTVKADVIDEIEKVTITTGDFVGESLLDEHGYWSVGSIPLSAVLKNEIKVKLTGRSGEELIDQYQILRTPGRIDSNIIGSASLAYAYSGSTDSVFSVNLESGRFDYVMSLDNYNASKSIAVSGEKLYALDQYLGLSVFNLKTHVRENHFGLKQGTIVGKEFTAPAGNIHINKITGDIYLYLSSSYDGNDISFYGKQVHILYKIDPLTGSLQEISGGQVGSGDRFYFSSNAFFDDANGKVYVRAAADSSAQYKLYEIDVGDGSRKALIDDSGNRILGISGDLSALLLRFDSSGNLSYFDLKSHEVLKRKVSNWADLNPGLYGDISLLSGSDGIYFSSVKASKVFSIDSNYSMKVVLDNQVDSWSDIFGSSNFYYNADSAIMYFTYMDAIGKYSLDSGRGIIVSSDNYYYHKAIVGGGDSMAEIKAMHVDARDQVAYVIDDNVRIYKVDLDTGDRHSVPLVTEFNLSNSRVSASYFDDKLKRLYFADDFTQKIYMVNLDSGVVSVFESYIVGTGYELLGVTDIKVDSSCDCMWVSQNSSGNSLIRIDLNTKDRSSVLTGELSAYLTGRVMATYPDAAGNLLYILTSNAEVYSLNKNSNELKKVARVAIGDVEVNDLYNGKLQLIEAAKVLLVGDNKGIYSINLRTGRSVQSR